MTATQVQIRRGSAAQIASFTGAAGEVVVDTTNWRLVVCDGSTPGGFPMVSTATPNTWTKTQTFAPPGPATTQAIVVNQSLPTGSQVASYSANIVTVTNPGYYTTGAPPGTPLDTWGLVTADTAFRVNYSATGGIPTAIHTALTAAAVATGRAFQTIGLAGSVYSNFASGLGSGTGDTIWAIIGYSNVGAAAQLYSAFALEAESAIATAGQVANRAGLNLITLGQGVASSIDTAILVCTSPSAPDASYGTPVPFTNLITFGKNFTGVAPLGATGSVFTTDGGTFTTGSFANLAGVTFTNWYVNFGNWAVNGSGYAVFGSGSASVPAAPIVLRVRIPSGGAVDLESTTNTTTGFSGVQAGDSSGNNLIAIGAVEAANTSVNFGQITGNFAKVVTAGSANLGLLLGTFNNAPFYLGTNNTLWLSLTGAGAFTFAGTATFNAATTFSAPVTVNATSFGLSGNISAPAWTTNGIRYKNAAATLTDTSSSGTVAAAYTDVWGGNTIAANSAVTFTNYYGSYFKAPVAGTNVGFTNGPWALGADSATFGTSNQFGVLSNGHVIVEGVTSTGSTGSGKFTFATSPTITSPTLATSALINANAATPAIPSALNTGVPLQIAGVDGSTARIIVYAAGTNKFGATNLLASRGTLASPAATQNGDFLGSYSAQGYGTSYQTGGGAGFTIQASETNAGGFDATHGGTALNIFATANGSVSLATVATFQAGIQVGAPTGGDKGAGTINCAADVYKNNAAYTNPDYVFEHYFTGKIERFAKNPRASDYRGLMPLDELAAYVRAHFRLPGIGNDPAGLFDRSDIALENIEALALYSLELHKRLHNLESATRH